MFYRGNMQTSNNIACRLLNEGTLAFEAFLWIVGHVSGPYCGIELRQSLFSGFIQLQEYVHERSKSDRSRLADASQLERDSSCIGPTDRHWHNIIHTILRTNNMPGFLTTILAPLGNCFLGSMIQCIPWHTVEKERAYGQESLRTFDMRVHARVREAIA